LLDQQKEFGTARNPNVIDFLAQFYIPMNEMVALEKAGEGADDVAGGQGPG
jgi:hypothetical protein